MSRRPFVLALLAAALFGAATPLSKFLLGTLPPVQMAALLYVGAAVGVLPLIVRAGSLRLPWLCDYSTQRKLGGAILFGGVLGPVLLLLGLRQAAAGSVSLWLNLEAVATALLGYFVFRDHLHRLGWLGAAGILLASMLLSWGEGAAGMSAGVLVALACLCWGVDNHLTALIDGISPAESTFWKGIAAGVVNLGAAYLVESPVWPARAISAALLVGVFSYGVSIVLYITAAQQTGATRSQLVFSTAPYFGLFLSVLLLSERLTAAQGGAGLLIAVSIGLLTLERHGHRHRHAGLTHDHYHTHDDGHHDAANGHQHISDQQVDSHRKGHVLRDGYPDGYKSPAGGGRSRHSHAHTHPVTEHAHAHLPDLHHRHPHAAQGHDGSHA